MADDDKKPTTTEQQESNQQGSNQQTTALTDSNAVFNPAIQDSDRSPGLAAARAENQQQDPNRRPTVTVMCGVRGGLVMQLHTLPLEADLPADFKLGHQETLRYGANAGIDKKFFDYWKSQNSGLGVVVEGLVTAQEEKQPEPAADTAKQDVSPDKSSSSAQQSK